MADDIRLGSEVVDTVSGFHGLVTARCEYWHDAPSVQVTATKLREGNTVREWFNERRVTVVDTGQERAE